MYHSNSRFYEQHFSSQNLLIAYILLRIGSEIRMVIHKMYVNRFGSVFPLRTCSALPTENESSIWNASQTGNHIWLATLQLVPCCNFILQMISKQLSLMSLNVRKGVPPDLHLNGSFVSVGDVGGPPPSQCKLVAWKKVL